MKTETKIGITIAPITLLGLFLFLKEIPNNTAVAEDITASVAQPQVLGLQTGQIRGIPLLTETRQPATFSLINPLELENIQASSFYVYDSYTGQVLAEKNADTRMGIASITKLLTVYLTYQLFNTQEITQVSPQDLISVTPIAHLHINDKLRYQDLIDAILVGSANDAAQLLGNRLQIKSGTSTAGLMNEYAARLGMKNSTFSNPLGFDSEANFSTARDISILVEALRPLHDFARTGKLTNFAFSGTAGYPYRVRATNKLLSKDAGLVAIKTGYTDEALGAMVTEFEFEERMITIIVLGSTSREADTALLKSTMLKNFSLVKP